MIGCLGGSRAGEASSGCAGEDRAQEAASDEEVSDEVQRGMGCGRQAGEFHVFIYMYTSLVLIFNILNYL
jgi:hypothetical protein